MHLEMVEKQLTPQQAFRLVEIAYETTDYALKDAAIKLLQRHLNPLVMAVSGPEDH